MPTSRSLSCRLVVLVFALFALLAAPAAFATTFTVDTDGSASDNSVGDGVCAILGGGCTLNAAIMEANNAPGGPHKIVFSIAIVHVAITLPLIQKPLTIDGAFGAPRVELVGAAGVFGLDVVDTAGGTTTGSGTIIKNLVIRNFGSEGIALSGGGNAVYNCYIGTDKLGTTAQPNDGAGISITTQAAPPFTFPPDLTNVAGNQIGDPSDASLGNLISGNVDEGITIFAQHTTLNVVANNKIGTDVTGNLAIPNGSHGVMISGDAFGNTIGPNNIISANTGLTTDGINITGTVMAPNIVKDNIIGASKSILADLGNTQHGIFVSAVRFDPSLADATEIGPNNIIGYNGGEGILITNAADVTKVWGNSIGVAHNPASPTVTVNIGNVLNGIHITTPGHIIGGPAASDTNVISSNQRSGILLGANATDVVIQGNIIGRNQENLINYPNTSDGITIIDGGNNKIGGTNAGESNVIAGNGRNGIKITSAGNGWANLISCNSIFDNGTLVTALGIDLDYNANGPDPTDNGTPGQDPNVLYANYAQNAPVVSSGGMNDPHWDPATGNTVVNWTIDTSALTPVTLEFYTSSSLDSSNFGEGQTYLGTATTVTDAAGHAAGTSPISPPSALDTRHRYVTMTATPTNTFPDLPGPTTSGTANNTSEFSNPVKVPNTGVLQFSAPTYTVGEGGVLATITVTRTGGSEGAVSIDYATSNGTAVQPLDYVSASGTLNWADADTASKTFTVGIIDDPIFEPTESVNLTLSNPQGYPTVGPQSTAVLNITDNDAQPLISINDVSLSEGNAGTTAFTFAVTLSNPSTQTISVNYATADGTATVANSDYVAASGTVTFLPGSVSQPVTVNVNGDVANETNETFFVNLTTPANATILDPQGQGTILNDDGAPSISIDDVAQSEGNAGTASFTFTVSLSAPSASTVTVDYATADGTATTAGGDYAAKSGTLTFLPGVTSQPVTVSVNGDTTTEGNETFFVNLTNPANASILDNQGLGTINNDDAVPQVSINDVSLSEGNAGTTAFAFNVTLSNPSASMVTVDYATADGTATTANSDYVAKSGTLTFLPGVVTQPITVNVNGDVSNEPNETFAVNLTNPTNATILDNQGQGTILNDDSTTPTFSVNNVAQSEGNAGTTTFTFTVTLAPASGSTVSVDATTADGTATVADSDYVAKTQTLNFPPGVTTQPFSVTVNGDAKFEPNETFTVGLSNPTAGTATSGLAGIGTINNDDTIPTIAINDVSLNEGNAGTSPFTFNVTLSNPSAQTVTVDYATANGTATTGGADYVAASGTVTFNPGVISQPVTVTVNGDGTVEPNETFFVNLTNPANGTIADNQGLGTILDDDAAVPPTFAITNVTQSEANAGTTAFTFTVTLTPAAAGATSVDAATADGTATTADGDYVAKTQTLNFPAGVTSQPFTVTVNGDAKFEPTEAFSVALSNPTGGAVVSGTNGSASGTINNDDPSPTISINDVSQNEGNAGTTAFTFNITLSNPSAQTITVDYATADGTATTGGSDYAGASGTLTFLPGVVSQPVTVNVNGDGNIESNETFFVNLTNPTNASILDNQGLGTIVNDDSIIPIFTIGNVTQAESVSGTTVFTFTVNLAPAAASTVSVDASTADGTATSADNDYVPNSQTLTFPPGTTSQPFMVTVNGDSKFETAEAFNVVLSNNSPGTTVSGVAGVGTITNDDTPPTISIGNISQVEGNAGTTAFTFTVTLSNASYQTVTVDYTTADGTATVANGDYAAASGTVTFLPNQTTQQVTINVNGDTNVEPNETFFVNLTNPTNAAITVPQGTATILDDDNPATATVPALGPLGLALLGLVLGGAAVVAMKR
jgi:hypothetical protein